jgi:hypothetical protein
MTDTGGTLYTIHSFVVAVLFMLALVVFLKKKPQTKQSLLSKRR